jgi:leucyl-tRNA synthetase
LATSKELKDRVTKLFGEGWTPEYDTLDTFVDSSWYYARYLDPEDDHDFSDQAAMKKWLPVNRYAGGAEHTTMHLLYSRFFYKALHDLALAPTGEPFHERFNRGLILGPDGQKMSKSKGNVINPDEFVAKYGADAVRVFLAFMGPYNEPGNYPFTLEGVGSMRKFLERAAALVALPDGAMTDEVSRSLARAAAKVAAESERFKFNTAVSALMILVRDLEKEKALASEAKRDLLRLIAPFAPHLAEHLWERAGGEGSVHAATWPAYDAALLAEETVSVAVQVNGKRRGEVSLPQDATEADALAAAQELSAVASALGGKPPARVVYVPGRILNLVASP